MEVRRCGFADRTYGETGDAGGFGTDRADAGFELLGAIPAGGRGIGPMDAKARQFDSLSQF